MVRILRSLHVPERVRRSETIVEVVSDSDIRIAYFEGFLKRHPVFPTQHTPVYSNTAFHLLGYALEVIAGDTFENILQSDVFVPLQLKNSGVRTPESGSGVIPPHAVKWDTDIGDETP